MELWYKGNLDKHLGIKGRLEILMEACKLACSQETSADPEGWAPENPLHGHCAVVALLVWDEFRGKFMRASLGTVKGYEQMRSHYWNYIFNEFEVDLTAEQFKGDDRNLVPPGKTTKRTDTGEEEITAQSLLDYEPTKKRYELLKKRVEIEYDKLVEKELKEMSQKGLRMMREDLKKIKEG